MNTIVELVIVGGIVAAAAAYVAYKVLGSARGKRPSCCGSDAAVPGKPSCCAGCSGCGGH